MSFGLGAIFSAPTAILGTVASVGGSLISADASKKASQLQAETGRASIAEQAREFDTEQAALAPYRSLGEAAIPTLRTAMGLPGGDKSSDTFGTLTKPFTFDPATDPGYQFRLGEGEKAIENSAAAKGTQLSGATLKELLKYGQDYASGEFQNAFNRDLQTKQQLYSTLTGTVGIGSGATSTGVQAGQTTAANIGNTLTGIGNAQASGIVGSANAISGGITGAANSAIDAYTLRQLMNNNTVTAPVTSGVNIAGSLPG